jgi:hypothetical protein
MPFQVLITPTPMFAIADVWGDVSLMSTLQLISTIAEDSRLHDYPRVLVNFLDADGALGEVERRLAGEAAAENLKHLDRVATVVRRNVITGTTEASAVQHGLSLRTFDTIGEAVHWLSTPSAVEKL